MKQLLYLLLITIFFVSCEKSENDSALSGNYTGTFQRSSPGGNSPKNQVSLNLNAGSFSGTSSDARFPAICHGSWEIRSNKIQFNNACVWTADFDWTLILDGEFQYQLNGNHLKLWKVMGEITDTYELYRN
jgi:hypothetical protein